MKRYISVSQANTFQTCSFKYYLEYQVGLKKKQELTPMALGLAVHVGIEAGLRAYWEPQLRGSHVAPAVPLYTQDAVYRSLKMWSDENRPENRTVPGMGLNPAGELVVVDQEDRAFYADWDNMIETAYKIVVRLFEHLDIPNNWEIVEIDGEPLIEAWLEAPVSGTDFWVRGKVDAVLRSKHTGLIEVIDWKTRDRFTDDHDEKLSMQLGIYQHMLRMRGVDAMVGTVYQISSRLPAIPQVNKDGSLSRRLIATDWATYEAALDQAGLDPRDYGDMQAKLSEYEFFRPIQVVRNERITARLWNNLSLHAQRIAVTDKEAQDLMGAAEWAYPKAYGYPCRNCQFAPICLADLHGWDVDEIIETDYERREERREATTQD